MFKKKLCLNDLDKDAILRPINIIEARPKVRIGVIDDAPFQALVNLRLNGYDVNYLDTTASLASLQNYEIIVCDILDVGVNDDEQGAALIADIKRVFPEKQVIAFTSLPGNTRLFRLAKERADVCLSKSIQPDVWYSILDEAISKCLDPRAIWARANRKLEAAGVTPTERARLEDVFVRAVKVGTPDPLAKMAQKKRVPAAVKSVAFTIANSAFWTVVAVL